MARRADEPVEVLFDELVHETSDAYKILIDDEEYWIPKSLCVLDEEEPMGCQVAIDCN